MSVDFQTILTTAVVPFVAAVAAAWVVRWLAPAEIGKRYALGFAVAGGFFTGYWLLPDAALVPVKYWQWLPYLAAGAVLGAMTLAGGATWPERVAAHAMLALVAAWLLVPDWEVLQPPRHVAVPLLAGYFLLLMTLLTALPDRLVGPQFVALLSACAGVLGLLIAIGLSFSYGQIAAVAAAALGGAWLAALVMQRSRRGGAEPADWLTTSIRGLIPVFAILVGGLAFVGTIDPDPPMPSMLVAPVALLLLWLFGTGPLGRLQGFPAVAAQVAAVALPWIIALAIVAWSMVNGILASIPR
ncbi:MAG: hypothetical protein L0211_12485 [Planctomycetaceae bacterium]|nr:hypothetical protein [Planctomycetaceae bacterium]